MGNRKAKARGAVLVMALFFPVLVEAQGGPPQGVGNDTNAQTLCGTGELLDGDGNCIPFPVDTDTSAATECAADEVLLGAGGGCISIVALALSKTFFVTSQRFTGDLGAEADNLNSTDCSELSGLDAGDCICQTVADRSTMVPAGTYKAWLSDSSGSPNTRWFHSPGPYVNVNGEMIAHDYSDLTDGSLLTKPSIDENGTAINVRRENTVWTGTLFDGSAASDHCTDWSSNLAGSFGVLGSLLRSDSFWSAFTALACRNHNHVYCAGQ